MTDLPPSVTLGEGEGGLPVVDIATEKATARVYLHGAHLTAWTPAGAEPVIWLSPASRFESGTAIRGGIPICLPWFGKGLGGDREPAHGVARIQPWELIDASDADGTVALNLRLQEDGWSASLTIEVGETLLLELTTANHGDTNLQIEEALHTYFAVSDVAQVSIEGLEGAAYFDKVTGDRATQDGPVTFTGRTDRVYESEDEVRIVDAGRTITVEKHNSANTVVWNPWAETAAAMEDIPNDAWPGFVCVETANVGGNAAILVPGTSRTMCTRYVLEENPA